MVYGVKFLNQFQREEVLDPFYRKKIPGAIYKGLLITILYYLFRWENVSHFSVYFGGSFENGSETPGYFDPDAISVRSFRKRTVF